MGSVNKAEQRVGGTTVSQYKNILDLAPGYTASHNPITNEVLTKNKRNRGLFIIDKSTSVDGGSGVNF